MSYEPAAWIIPVVFVALKRINNRQVLVLSSAGICIFVFYFLKNPQPFFYYLAGILFLIVSGFVRYSFEKEFKNLCFEHSRVKEEIAGKIKETESEISIINKSIFELEKNISTYEMSYSISKILVKQIDFEEMVEGIKAAVFFSRPYVKLFNIHTIKELPGLYGQARNLPEKRFGFEVPISLGEERFGVIQAEVDKGHYSFSVNFLEECRIIANQVAFALKRDKLYQLVLDRSRVDGLTGLYLRRYFVERLKEAFVLFRRYGSFFSFLMIDIDHFKKVNDTYGHLAGDKVLGQLSNILKSVVHQGVIACRYGGEEFAMLIEVLPVKEVRQMAEKLRKTVEESAFVLPDGENIHMSVSIGIAYRHQAESENEIIRKADEALYRAKTQGRNRVVEY